MAGLFFLPLMQNCQQCPSSVLKTLGSTHRVSQKKNRTNLLHHWAVMRPTAGSSHYAIRESRWSWSVAPHLAAFFLSSAPVHCKEAVSAQTALQLTV